MWNFLLIVSILLMTRCYALNNGLARTPPMGWISWERFRCTTDCLNFPNECVSDGLYRTTADLLVSEGYADVGYEYVIVDDCWMANARDQDGRLQADSSRFPRGIKALANYVQSKGLKFGLYESFGTVTCEGYPGSLDHLELDANTFAEWDVDYVKFDGCFTDIDIMDEGYPSFGRYLNETGRPMVYSCSWPYYQQKKGITPNFTKVMEHCNLWRIYEDVHDTWWNVLDIIEWFAGNQDTLISAAGPGHWNDPDMLLLGNFGLSFDQCKTQMAIWAILAAPLIMSNNLKTVKPEIKEILQNRDIIAINQDPLGIQGKRIMKNGTIGVWIRPISPVGITTSYALAFNNVDYKGMPSIYSISLGDLGLTNPKGYAFKDVFEGNTFVLEPSGTLRVRINPSGVVLYKAIVLL